MPNTVALFGKSFDQEGAAHLQQLLDKLKMYNCRLMVYASFFEQIEKKVAVNCDFKLFNSHDELRDSADILISVGGDGTLLDTITLVRDSGIPVLGVNLGRLGFLSSISREEILPAIDKVMNDSFSIEPRTLLSISTGNNLFGDINFALNELSITKANAHALAVVHVYVNDKFLNTYWADGLIVATPTGSTAYSMSCFGPIVTPDSDNFVITPIASHNLTVRPIVLPNNSTIRLVVGGRNRHYQVGLDSRFQTIDQNTEIIVTKADFKINLIQLHSKDFFSTIREKLLWGKDQRN